MQKNMHVQKPITHIGEWLRIKVKQGFFQKKE